MSGIYYQVSASPHVRNRLSTGRVMLDVIISLIPAACAGVINYGTRALAVILLSVGTAVLSEAAFDLIAKKGMTVKDGSAVVTGLLLALCLSPSVPWFIPVLGSVFAIIFVKSFFGGLGRNFMNPALAARCFLLISFSGIMTNYSMSDAVSSATPLASLLEDRAVNLTSMFLGSASGVIGSSILALLIGGVYLIAARAISWEIPVSFLLVFALFIGLFGGHWSDPSFVLAHLMGGGTVLGALFMATDPVTSPVTSVGMLIYGAAAGLLTGLFRVFATAADSTSYAIIIANLLTPLLDEFIIPKPFGFREQERDPDKESRPFTAKLLKPAVNLLLITAIAGIGLAAAFNVTKDTIAEQELKKKLQSYSSVLPGAETFEIDENSAALIESMQGSVYGTDFGRAYINEVAVGKDAAGGTAGYVISVTSADGYDGRITLSLGVDTEGVTQGIEFTELNETAGMGMRCDEPGFKDQFRGVDVERFTLNKAGGSTADDEIDSVSGASVSSGAVVNAVNAALDFLHKNIG